MEHLYFYPVGPYYTREQAELFHRQTGAICREDPKGNGWRKVVVSPKPVRINNLEFNRQLVEVGNIVLTVSGGGIPVIDYSGFFSGIEAMAP